MAACITVTADNALYLDPISQIDTCAYVLVQSTEYTTISGLNALFAEYFAFDTSLFELIITAYLLSFISGHILGRIISGLRKAG
ncbi:MAG: hypothetical protein ACOYM1_10750 [Methylovulum sp.]